MKGTEKQVAWAEEIRAALAQHWESLKAETGTEPPASVAAYMADVLNHDDAKYYIDEWRTAPKMGTKGYLSLKSCILERDETPEEVRELFFDWAELGL